MNYTLVLYEYTKARKFVMTDDYIDDLHVCDSIQSGTLATLKATLRHMSNKNDLRTDSIEFLNMFKPKETYISLLDFNGSMQFYGRLYSIKQSTDSNGTFSIIAEDLRGCLRDGFIMYGPQRDEDSYEESGNKELRGKKGENVMRLLTKIRGAYNAFNSHYKLKNFELSGFNMDDYNITLPEDVSIEGSNIFDALKEIADTCNLEWKVWTGSAGFFYDALIVHFGKRIAYNLGGKIRAGFNLTELSMSIDTSSIVTAIVPYGGYGFNEHRLTLAENDYNMVNETRPVFVANDDLVEAFGYVLEPRTYDSIVANDEDEVSEKISELLKKATSDAEKLSENSVEFNLNAIDLYSLTAGTAGVAPIRCWNEYTLVDPFSGGELTVRCTMSDICYTNPDQSTFSFEASMKDLLELLK